MRIIDDPFSCCCAFYRGIEPGVKHPLDCKYPRTARSCMPTKVSPEGKKYSVYAKIPDISVDFIFATAAIHFVNEGHRNAKLHAAMSTTALELHE